MTKITGTLRDKTSLNFS